MFLISFIDYRPEAGIVERAVIILGQRVHTADTLTLTYLHFMETGNHGQTVKVEM